MEIALVPFRSLQGNTLGQLSIDDIIDCLKSYDGSQLFAKSSTGQVQGSGRKA